MKKVGLLLSALAITVSSFATTGNDVVKVKSEGDSKIAIMQGRDVMKLVYLNDKQSKVEVAIYDESGSRLLETKVNSKDGFIQPFSFEELEIGNYTFEITDESGTVIEKVNFDRSKKSKSVVYNIQETNKFKVNILAEGQEVSIKIYDENYNAIYRDTLSGAESFSRVYDLNGIAKGNYIFKVTSGDHTDWHTATME